MFIRSLIWTVYTILDFLFVMYHEMWHYFAAKIVQFCTFGDVWDIRMQVSKYPSVEFNNDQMTMHRIGAQIIFTHPNTLDNKWLKFITVAPAVGCIVLFLLSPWYMWLLYIPYMDMLWLSASDVFKLTEVPNFKPIYSYTTSGNIGGGDVYNEGAQEKLDSANKNGNGPIIQNLSQQEAVAALVQGKAVTHRSFDDEEWMKADELHTTYTFENGVEMSVREFWNLRRVQSEFWLDGWSIVDNPVSSKTNKLIIINEPITEELPEEVTEDNFTEFDHIGDDTIDSDLADLDKKMSEYLRAKDLAEQFQGAVNKETLMKLGVEMRDNQLQRERILVIKHYRTLRKRDDDLSTFSSTQELG